MRWPDPRGARVLVGMLHRELRGVPDVVPPIVPPHLQDIAWRFVCWCGVTWTRDDSAIVRDGQIGPPRRQCVSCGAWVSGHPVSLP